MAETATIARPYAEAVFQRADSTGTLATWSEWLGRLSAVAALPEVATLAGDPKLNPEQLYGVVMAAGGADAPAEVQNFVRVLIENNRIGAIPAVRDQFEVLRHEREGVVEAEVSTAFPLDAAQLAQVVADLEARFKRKVNAKVTVDASLIGGVRVTVGDEVIDASVRGKLDQMAAALKS
jgi:F-type H+-transporting ATPase subunit delta